MLSKAIIIFKISERSTDIDLVRDAVHTKRNLKDRAVRRSDSRQSRSTTRSSQPSVHTSIDNIEQVKRFHN